MADYIDRETTIAALREAIRAYPLSFYNGIEVAITAIKKAPAADVVEVVRCKDCKHSYDSVGGRICSRGVCVDCVVPDDFLCAYGERRSDDE